MDWGRGSVSSQEIEAHYIRDNTLLQQYIEINDVSDSILLEPRVGLRKLDSTVSSDTSTSCTDEADLQF